MRVLLGIAQAANDPVAYSMMQDSFPPDKLGTANAFLTGAAFLGGGLCSLNILLIQNLGWRSCLTLLGTIGCIISACTMLLVKEPAKIKASPDEIVEEEEENESFISVFKSSLYNCIKNPQSRWITVAGSLRMVVMFAGDYFLPLFFLLSFPDFKKQFSVLYGLCALVFGFISVLSGGILSDRWG